MLLLMNVATTIACKDLPTVGFFCSSRIRHTRYWRDWSSDGALPISTTRSSLRTSDGRVPGEPRRVAYLYLLPAFAVFALFVLAPLVHSAWISLFAWDGVTEGEWVGLENYEAVVSDPELRGAFGHALVLLVFFAVLPVAIGLALAAALSRTRVRGLTAFRTVLFL